MSLTQDHFLTSVGHAALLIYFGMNFAKILSVKPCALIWPRTVAQTELTCFFFVFFGGACMGSGLFFPLPSAPGLPHVGHSAHISTKVGWLKLLFLLCDFTWGQHRTFFACVQKYNARYCISHSVQHPCIDVIQSCPVESILPCCLEFLKCCAANAHSN